MSIKDKYESKMQKAILSCDGFTTAYFVMILLYFAGYVAKFDQLYAAAFLPIACLIPFVLMPVFYSIVHRFSPLLFGRYHLLMPVSAIVAAVFFVLMWSAEGSGAGESCKLFFGALIFAVTVPLYRYCSFSVRARLSKDNIARPSVQSMCFSAVGAVCAVGTFCGFYFYDLDTAFVNTAYVIGAVCMILAITQYLTTFYGIPKLGGKRIQSVKSIYRAFYTGLNKRTYFSALLFQSAFMIGIALILPLAAALGLPDYAYPITAAVFVLSFGGCALFCSVKIRRRTKLLSVVVALCFFAASALAVVAAVVELSFIWHICAVVSAAFLIGLGGAIVMRQTRLRFLTVKNRTTSGTVFILLELTAFASAAIAVVVSTVVSLILPQSGTYAFIYGFAAATALTVAALITARKKTSRSEVVPELSYELSSDEFSGSNADRSVSSDNDGNAKAN